jgi:hypothetical protein
MSLTQMSAKSAFLSQQQIGCLHCDRHGSARQQAGLADAPDDDARPRAPPR